MPAPFVTSLCGYREGRPNTSDKNDKGSIGLGTAYFEAMGVPADALPPQSVGNLMAAKVSVDLQQRLETDAPHLSVTPERAISEFEQYSHLNAARDLRSDLATEVVRAVSDLRKYTSGSTVDDTVREMLDKHMGRIRAEVRLAEERRRDLLNLLGEESLLKLDIAVSRILPNPISARLPLQHLIAGLSLKWTLRTDRAQDCRMQGSKMTSLRRGRMPHFAAVTMEPRPSMLALLGRGSGDVDCVYHLDLPSLSMAIDDYCSGTQRKARLGIRDNFKRLCDQRRVRDYDELPSYLATL